ncbi:zinc finger protein RFP-like [Neopsephotus bourkii]|uniref:zinc finger protein RFP-like n=1 Tax=Neopsephotus bourkii TaxID=309878 RepID=UPI002AA50A43|nr:zinc finger protein RFP-like [Neopsephotus bourkii]
MSAPSPSTALPREASCPICLEYFRDPVSIHCGHNFCRACISRCWEWATAPFPCPRCREAAPERTLHPSRELARVLEAARRLSAQAAGGDPGQGERCERHQEPLKLFCEEDGAFVCVICRESRAHRSHRMLPAQDALQGYKGQIQARLQALKEERDKLLGLREAEMRRNWEYLEKTTAERQRVLSKLEGLRLFLEDHAQHLLAQLGDLERDIEKLQEENVTSLTKEISRLDSFIQEMEEKSQQPANQFLQDIRGTLSRLEMESFQQPPLLLAELEERINHFRDRNSALEETLRSFQVKVTLDPSTAHPQLVVSADGSSVRWDNDAHQDPCTEGLGTDPCVLGSEGITVGRCCWEVEVAPRGSWAVGVATRPLGRREEGAEGPGMELWSMGLCEGQFWALTSLERIPLYQLQVPTRVQVSLDYDRGQVAFFDADKRSLIFTFPAASFKGESVHPWFLVWGEGAHITLCP